MLGTIAVWLGSIVGGLAIRVLIALGMGVLTFSILAVVKTQLDAAIDGSLAGMVDEIYQLLALAGFVDALGIWLGAITAAITLMALGRIARLNQ